MIKNIIKTLTQRLRINKAAVAEQPAPVVIASPEPQQQPYIEKAPEQKYLKSAETNILTAQYPVATTLGNYLDFWKGPVTGIQAIAFFGDSPLQNTDGEMIIGRLVRAAAEQDAWCSEQVPMTRDEIVAFEANKKLGRLNHFGRGLAAAIDQGMIALEEIGGSTYITPKERLVALTRERVTRYA